MSKSPDKNATTTAVIDIFCSLYSKPGLWALQLELNFEAIYILLSPTTFLINLNEEFWRCPFNG